MEKLIELRKQIDYLVGMANVTDIPELWSNCMIRAALLECEYDSEKAKLEFNS